MFENLNKYTNLRLRKATVYLLKQIAAKRGISMIELIEEFANDKAREMKIDDDTHRTGNRNRNRNS